MPKRGHEDIHCMRRPKALEYISLCACRIDVSQRTAQAQIALCTLPRIFLGTKSHTSGMRDPLQSISPTEEAINKTGEDREKRNNVRHALEPVPVILTSSTDKLNDTGDIEDISEDDMSCDEGMDMGSEYEEMSEGNTNESEYEEIHQKEFPFPSIQMHWECYQTSLLAKLTDRAGLTISGDARHDSMGHSAKFGACTVYCNDTSELIHFSLVQ
eukprot:gene1727-1925_t